MALAGLFTATTTAVNQLETLTRFIPTEATQIVINQAKSVAGRDKCGLGLAAFIGLGTAFYSATTVMAALIEGLNVAFDVSELKWSFFPPFAVSRLIGTTPDFGTVETLRWGVLRVSPTPSSDVTGGTSTFTEYAAS
jgi:uncharacterized BrkB/YihY/UPF0761 family membrane protein